MRRQRLAVLIAALMLSACAPKVSVVRNPNECDKGIRYYRPKPYLLVTPAGTTKTTTKEGQKTTTIEAGQTDEFVQIELQYLPDFSEEYAINVEPGLGTANVKVELEDGWNLTSINQDLDTKFAENVEALANLAKAGAAAIPTAGPPSTKAVERTQRWVVTATNVPLGYYESVIGIDPYGEKRLYGWRYLGFVPFNACPTDIGGMQSMCCDDECAGIYGLVFENGVMVFKQLDCIVANLNRVPVDTGEMKITAAKSQKEQQATIERQVNVAITLAGYEGDATTEIQNGALEIVIRPEGDATAQQAIRKSLGQRTELLEAIEELSLKPIVRFEKMQ